MIMGLRKQELDVLKKYAYLNAASSFTWTCAPFLVREELNMYQTFKFLQSPCMYFIGIVSMYYCMDFRRATKADEGEFTLPVSS